jgi:hypothetical protein
VLVIYLAPLPRGFLFGLGTLATVVFSLTVTMTLLLLYRREWRSAFPSSEAHCLIGRQRASRLAPAIDGPGVPVPHQEQRSKTAPRRPRRDPQMVADLGQSPWVE